MHKIAVLRALISSIHKIFKNQEPRGMEPKCGWELRGTQRLSSSITDVASVDTGDA